MKKLFFVLSILLSYQVSLAQNISINESGTPPHESAILDLNSPDKGLLIPRLETSAIASPVAGLMVFQPSDNGFYFHNGTEWMLVGVVPKLISDADGDTKIETEQSMDEDTIRFTADGFEIMKLANNGLSLDGDLDVGDGTLFADVSANRVGIGTKNPAADLHVFDNTFANIRVQSTTDSASLQLISPLSNFSWLSSATTNNFQLYDHNALASRLYLSGTNGNIGIGTTNPLAKLDVNGKIRMQDGANVGYIPVSDANGIMSWTDPKTIQTLTDNDWQIDEDTLFTLASQYVGIGTDNPSEKLEIVGGLKVDETTLYVDSNNDRVGIGTTSPTAKLEVAGGLKVDTTTFFVDESNDLVGIGTTSPDTKLEIVGGLKVDESTFFVDASNDRVGIGTTSPETKLHVEGDMLLDRLGNTTTLTRSLTLHGNKNGSGLYAKIEFKNVDQQSAPIGGSTSYTTYSGAAIRSYKIGVEATGDLRFYTNSGSGLITRLVIDRDGDVGIGTVDPTEKLDVNGSIRMRTGATSGYVPVSNASGVMTWKNPNTLTSMPDEDWLLDTDTVSTASSIMVGVGVASPDEKLDVDGKIKMRSGAVNGFIPVSDADGVMTWTDPASLPGINDNDWLIDADTLSTTSNIFVGIGTNDPQEKLHISEGNVLADRGPNSSGVTRKLIIEGARNGDSNPYAEINFNNFDNNGNSMSYTGGAIRSFNEGEVNDGNLVFYTSNDATLAERMIIDDKGEVGIGNSFPNHLLHLTNAWCTGTTWVDGSDSRLKKDIVPLEYGIKDILKIRPVSYRYKSNNTSDIGFIAQEIQDIIPEIISGKEGDVEKGETLGMSYGHLTAVLVNAIQEQQAMTDELIKENEMLKEMLASLYAKIELLIENGDE